MRKKTICSMTTAGLHFEMRYDHAIQLVPGMGLTVVISNYGDRFVLLSNIRDVLAQVGNQFRWDIPTQTFIRR